MGILSNDTLIVVTLYLEHRDFAQFAAVSKSWLAAAKKSAEVYCTKDTGEEIHRAGKFIPMRISIYMDKECIKTRPNTVFKINFADVGNVIVHFGSACISRFKHKKKTSFLLLKIGVKTYTLTYMSGICDIKQFTAEYNLPKNTLSHNFGFYSSHNTPINNYLLDWWPLVDKK